MVCRPWPEEMHFLYDGNRPQDCHTFVLIDGVVVRKSFPMLTDHAVVVEADQSVPSSPSDDPSVYIRTVPRSAKVH